MTCLEGDIAILINRCIDKHAINLIPAAYRNPKELIEFCNSNKTLESHLMKGSPNIVSLFDNKNETQTI